LRRDSVLIALFYNILMEEQNNTIASVEAPVDAANVQPAVDAAPKKKKVTRSRKKVVAPEAKEETKNEAAPEEKIEEPAVENKTAEKKPEKASKKETVKEVEKPVEKPAVKPIPKMPKNLVIRDFCDLANSGGYIPLLSDQQIQQLTYEEAYERDLIFEAIISNVLDYDIVLSDTNIWLELLVGHTSSHSDPRVNARLMFERQLEFISKMCKKIGGKFTIMSETYEEVDRFATMQEPTDYKLADWKDPALCLNVAARLAKRLMLYQQKENRLRIEGIGSESHHSSFADPAIIRRTVELFAQGKKVLLLTNDASVAIRSLGMCDDLQRTNEIGDVEWREIYEPQRPMVLTMDDLKLLDQYTRQYHFLTLAAGRQWMQDVQMRQPVQIEKPLSLWIEGFRPGDRRERRSDKLEQQKKEYEKQRLEQERKEQERKEQERREQARLEQERREAEKQARREEQERREQENRERKEQARLEQQRREEQRRADRERAAAEKAARLAAEEEARKQQTIQTAADQTAQVENDSVAETPAEAPLQDVTPIESPVEEAPVIELPPLSPEMMELMGPSSSEKKRTRRGGRRRKTTADTAEQK
jgi:flagellar biosynthesis GTPase FlhF